MGGTQLEEQLSGDDSDADPIVGNEETLEWHKIGRKVLARSRRVPVTGFMSDRFCYQTLLNLSQAWTPFNRTEEAYSHKESQTRKK